MIIGLIAVPAIIGLLAYLALIQGQYSVSNGSVVYQRFLGREFISGDEIISAEVIKQSRYRYLSRYFRPEIAAQTDVLLIGTKNGTHLISSKQKHYEEVRQFVLLVTLTGNGGA